MPLPPEFWGTLDTVVKVGLGVAITGLFTISHGIVSNKHERKKELQRRRRDALEQACRDVEAGYTALMWVLNDLRTLREGDPDNPSVDLRNRLEQGFRGLRDSADKLEAVGGKLLLLGLPNAEKSIREIRDLMKDFMGTITKSKSLSPDDVQVRKCWDSIAGTKKRFYGELSPIYCEM